MSDFKEMMRYIDNLGFGRVEKYLMFFGFKRSGHLWIGFVLDAAPNAMIANEWNAFKRFRTNSRKGKELTRDVLFAKLAKNFYLCGRYGRIQVYNYSIPGLCQGRIGNGHALEVIGDKKGGKTSNYMVKMAPDPLSNAANAKQQRDYFYSFF